MNFAEVYIDESGSHDGSPVLCVAGYVFKKTAAVEFDKEWRKSLEKAELPYFRMSACAHGTEPFQDKTMDERIEIETKLIELTKRTTCYGFAVTVSENEYDAIVPKVEDLGGAYSFCLRNCLIHVRSWADDLNFIGKIAYFFEAGHRHQRQAGAIMERVFKEPRLHSEYHYADHAFADKIETPPLQAADLLAWQWYTDTKRKRSGIRQSRKDCMALVRPQQDYVMDFNTDALNELRGLIHAGKIKIL